VAADPRRRGEAVQSRHVQVWPRCRCGWMPLPWAHP
jgi:hypothetical protein